MKFIQRVAAFAWRSGVNAALPPMRSRVLWTRLPGCAVTLLAIAVVLSLAGCSEDSNLAASSATNAPMLIVPNASVGKLRAGMTVQQAVAELGEPKRKTANALEYPALGLAVMPGPDGVVQVVMCGDVTGINGPYVKAFAGRTKEGIGMRSTREEVIKAYGEPTRSEKSWGGLESLRYDSLGITFTLEGGKVCHMIVRLGGAQEPERAVKIELAPGAAKK